MPTDRNTDDGSTVVRIPASARSETVEAEFLRLMDQRDRITARLEVLCRVIHPTPAIITALGLQLQQSGLTQAAPNDLLFKGGRNAE